MGLQVLITDYAWPTLDIERDILGRVGAELVVAQTGEEPELVSLAPKAHAILTNWKSVTPAVLSASRSCKVVARYGIGLDNIAVASATELGILVTNVPDYCLEEVSDHTMALLLACSRGVVRLDRSTHQGVWDLHAGQPLMRLRGKTLGLLGYGNIAKNLIPKAQGFGLEIIAYNPHIPYGRMVPFGTLTNNLEFVLRESDFVSIHVPLNTETKGMVDARVLKLMKPSAFLINTSRGAVINEADLCCALREGWIAGAALDVIASEPPGAMNPLLDMDNVISTPHAAFYSDQSIEEVQRQAASQVAQVLSARVPPHVVNPQVQWQTNFRLETERAAVVDSRVHVS